MHLSEARPPQPLETKVIAPCGEIAIKNLMVLWCLYCDHVCALALRAFGRSQKISKQSITATHLREILPEF